MAGKRSGGCFNAHGQLGIQIAQACAMILGAKILEVSQGAPAATAKAFNSAILETQEFETLETLLRLYPIEKRLKGRYGAK